MKTAIDSSAFVKRYVQEHGSDELYQILQNTAELALSVILVPEIISGLQRRVREGFLSRQDYNSGKKQLLADVRDATILQTTPPVILRSITLLESNVLRAMDSIPIACAIEWQADLFVTSDKKQHVAAVNAGLKSEYVG